MHRKDGEHPYGDTGQLIILGLFLVVWAEDSFFLHALTFMPDFLSVYIRLVILALMLAVAAYLISSGHKVVNAAEHATGIVSNGAFRYVRHPLYLASILAYAGLSLATASLLSLMMSTVAALFYNYIASYEEEILQRKYGQAYSTYKEQTGKWFPKIRKHNRPHQDKKYRMEQ
jgi:protein-S-isoprenylcysteine O-methyltransferase Ste14